MKQGFSLAEQVPVFFAQNFQHVHLLNKDTLTCLWLVKQCIKYIVKIKQGYLIPLVETVDANQQDEDATAPETYWFGTNCLNKCYQVPCFIFNKILDELFDQLGDDFNGYCLHFDQVSPLKILGPNKQDTCSANENPCFISSILLNKYGAPWQAIKSDPLWIGEKNAAT